MTDIDFTGDHAEQSQFVSHTDELVLLAAATSLANPDPELVHRIDPEEFSGILGGIWRIARDLANAGQPITPRAILASTKNANYQAALAQVKGQIVSSNRIIAAETAVRECAKLRRLEGALGAARERMLEADSYSEAIEATHAEIASLATAEPARAVRDFADISDDWLEHIQAPHDQVRTIPTPWPGLDDVLAGGLQPGRTYVIGGRPGEGKSIAGINLAVHAAELGHPALIFSAEMGEHEVASRVIASGARAEYGQIMKRRIDDHNFSRIAEYLDTNRTMPLRIVDKSDISVDYIAATARSVKRKHGLDVIFVDYLQLLRESDSKLARERQVAQMSKALKVLSRELDVAIVIASQLNRNSANEKRPPALSDLRESGAIEADADVAILLHHIRADNGDHTGDLDLILAKNRTGKQCTITCRWSAYQARIKRLP